MQPSSSSLRLRPPAPAPSPILKPPSIIHLPKLPTSLSQPQNHPWPTSTTTTTILCAALRPSNTPKGFGPKKLKKPTKRNNQVNEPDDDEDSEEDDGEDYFSDSSRQDSVIPEVVTNRMISRIGLSVGIPLFVGLLFFPFFYYLKVVLKLDVPSFIPVMVSFVFFGAALAGVSYGIVSTSWDPLREGSALGWKEAQRNWPVFWGSIWNGGSGNNKSQKFK